MSNKAVYRTAPATPGLLINIPSSAVQGEVRPRSKRRALIFAYFQRNILRPRVLKALKVG